MPRVPTACGTARPPRPCTSGTTARASRAPRGARWAASSCGSTASGSATQVLRDTSGTIPQARARGRSRHVLSSKRRPGAGARLSRHRAERVVRRRSAEPDRGQPWKCMSTRSGFRPHSVHEFHFGRIPTVAAVHSVLLLFAGISWPFLSVRERSKHPCPSMVRKGSSVRVRQRASQEPRKWPDFREGGHCSADLLWPQIRISLVSVARSVGNDRQVERLSAFRAVGVCSHHDRCC
jgi:hypothetical protein